MAKKQSTLDDLILPVWRKSEVEDFTETFEWCICPVCGQYVAARVTKWNGQVRAGEHSPSNNPNILCHGSGSPAESVIDESMVEDINREWTFNERED